MNAPGSIESPVPAGSGGLRDLLNIRHADPIDGCAVLEMTIRPEHLNIIGTLHGGVLLTLIDIACGRAVSFDARTGETRPVVTLSLATSFTGQASAGTVKAIGRKRAGGRTIAFASAEVFDERGSLIGYGEGNFRYVPAAIR
ncbi:PaaI family thioesterase [Paraburkholderia aromaticivorans]|uniref:PaaI family thioesterase n=1 Tax=Paraburkholderia aromaticivorans TaxID=2026199 RepID=UPI0014561F84|nr:PaaI family thioesterase [Paraburkholderia aromaticivorans]